MLDEQAATSGASLDSAVAAMSTLLLTRPRISSGALRSITANLPRRADGCLRPAGVTFHTIAR